MKPLPHNLYRAAQVRALDRIAIETYAIPGLTLMNRAGEAAFAALRTRWPAVRRVAVVCGGGNNGGDGFVVARLAHEAGYEVRVMLLAAIDSLKGDARQAYQAMTAAGVEPHPSFAEVVDGAEVIVDAMLGTGLDRAVEGTWREAIIAINAASLPVFSLDLPSGLNADSGVVMGVAVQADATISFIGLKQGMLTAAGVDHCGEILFDDLQLPAAVYDEVSPAVQRIDHHLRTTLLPRRARSAHKGDCGHVLLIGGASGMSGAVRMAGEAALRCGAGWMSVATAPEHAAVINLTRPELMVHGVDGSDALTPLIQKADVVAIGPGLGTAQWGMAMLDAVLSNDKPLVVDADALNLLAIEPYRRDDWVLTPHPGEAARLLNMAAVEVQADRFFAANALQHRYGGVAVLKGSGSLVVDQQHTVALCDGGNPGMASGGMGDVLTGVIAALIAQGMSLADAARLGVSLHAAAADCAVAHGQGERGLLASDLMPHLRRLIN